MGLTDADACARCKIDLVQRTSEQVSGCAHHEWLDLTQIEAARHRDLNYLLRCSDMLAAFEQGLAGQHRHPPKPSIEGEDSSQFPATVVSLLRDRVGLKIRE